jgi:two-component system, NarL family, sensor kinase
MKLFYIFFILILQWSFCLTNIFGNNDTTEVIRLNQKAWNEKSKNLELAKNYANKAISIAVTIKYPRGLSYSYNIIGYYHKVKGNFDSAETYFRKSLAIRERLKDTLNIARSYRNLMSIYKTLGEHKKAIETGLIAIQLLLPKIGNDEVKSELAWFRVNLGSIYSKVGDYETAVRSIMDGKKLFNSLDDDEGIADASMSLGNVYETQKQYTKAISEFSFAIQTFIQAENLRELAKAYNNLGNIYYALDSNELALRLYNKGLEIRTENEMTGDLASSFLNIGIVYEDLNKGDSAYHYFKQALSNGNEFKDVEIQYEAHRALGSLLNNKGLHNEALPHLLGSLRLSTKAMVLPEKIVLLKEIANAYRASGKKDSALLYTEEYMSLNDSLSEILRNSIELTSNLKEKELELTLSKEANKKQIIIIVGISTAFLLILIIFLMYYFAVRAKKRELQLREIIKEKELVALDALLMGQEEERKRLALELHDTIGSMLSATKYSFKAMEKSMEKMVEEYKSQYLKINSMLDETMDSVRRISHDMAAGIFTEKGIEGALSELCETFEQPGKMQITLNVYGFDEKLGLDIEKNLYQIVRELLANIVKHAHASEVTIQLLKNNKNINLTVEDNGIGFDLKAMRQTNGIGLSNVEKRVSHLAGKWSIDSEKGHGTTVVVDIPVNDNLA